MIYGFISLEEMKIPELKYTNDSIEIFMLMEQSLYPMMSL